VSRGGGDERRELRLKGYTNEGVVRAHTKGMCRWSGG